MVIHFEADVSGARVTHIQITIPESTADRKVVNLIALTVLVSWTPKDLMANSHHYRYGLQDHISSHLQISYQDYNVNFRKTLPNCM